MYLLTQFDFELDEETVEAMMAWNEQCNNDNTSDKDQSLESLEYEVGPEGRPSLPNRLKYKKIKSSLDVITSASCIEEEFSDCTWEKADYQEKFDKNYGQIKDYFSNNFFYGENTDNLSHSNATSMTNEQQIPRKIDRLNTFTLK